MKTNGDQTQPIDYEVMKVFIEVELEYKWPYMDSVASTL